MSDTGPAKSRISFSIEIKGWGYDKAKYTIEFGADGRFAARIDCQRGAGTWKSAGPNQLELGPMALTRAMCPPAPLNDRIPRDLSNVRSYVVKDSHLFLALMADGGIYVFEPSSKTALPQER
jgi:para-nitrobenzyl esterase